MPGHPHHLARVLHRGVELENLFEGGIFVIFVQNRHNGIDFRLVQRPHFSIAEPQLFAWGRRDL